MAHHLYTQIIYFCIRSDRHKTEMYAIVQAEYSTSAYGIYIRMSTWMSKGLAQIFPGKAVWRSDSFSQSPEPLSSSRSNHSVHSTSATQHQKHPVRSRTLNMHSQRKGIIQAAEQHDNLWTPRSVGLSSASGLLTPLQEYQDTTVPLQALRQVIQQIQHASVIWMLKIPF